MEKKESLTNEELSKRFKSQFDLVNYAIRLAENMIRTGRAARAEMESQNRTLQILGEIKLGKDHLDEIIIVEEREPSKEEKFARREDRETKGEFFGRKKFSDAPKKNRKILV